MSEGLSRKSKRRSVWALNHGMWPETTAPRPTTPPPKPTDAYRSATPPAARRRQQR